MEGVEDAAQAVEEVRTWRGGRRGRWRAAALPRGRQSTGRRAEVEVPGRSRERCRDDGVEKARVEGGAGTTGSSRRGGGDDRLSRGSELRKMERASAYMMEALAPGDKVTRYLRQP